MLIQKTLCALILGGGALTAAAVTFQEFSGVCQGGAPLENAVGWDRADFGWSEYEPQPGQYRDRVLEERARKVLELRRQGVTMLPIFCYTTDWSHRELPYEYLLTPETRVRVEERDGGGFKTVLFRLEDGEWQAGREENRDWMRLPLSPEGTEHFKEYVSRSAAMLMQEPYNLEYFQIWNEAWPTSGFWDGSLDDYMTSVHLPGAQAIRDLGGKVVYGGWACAGDIALMVELFDRHDAWDSIDVIDMHYFPLSSMEFVRRALEERGLDKAIWQTEIGFTADPNFIGNLYPRVLAWGLKYGMDRDPDKYKLFYFARWSPDDPAAYGYRRTLFSGDRLGTHGQALLTLARLFGEDDIALYGPVATRPELNLEIDERLSSMEAFEAGNRVIVAIHMIENNSAKIFTDWNGDLRSIHLNHDDPLIEVSLPGIAPGDIERVERVSMLGAVQDITEGVTASGDGSLIHAPIRDPRTRDAAYVEMPEDTLPQVFYLNIIRREQGGER